MRAVGTMQAARHDILIVQAPLPPALAKNARTGHPFPDRERKKAERLGHPPSEQYDAEGNTTFSSGNFNNYDFENRLQNHAGAVSIFYDGDGNRFSETVGNLTTNYLVDTQNPTGYAQVVDELQSGTVTRTYSYGLERISETQTINSTLTTSFYGYDGHGSVRFLTNSTGAVTDTYDYDAFGNLINQTGSTPNNYLFAGEQYDPALGLYYNRARYLNTNTGRFWSMDTFQGDPGSPDSLHKYVYAASDPVDRIDPSGHEDIGEALAVASDYAVLGAIAGLSASAAIGVTAAAFLADNLPHNAFSKPADGSLVGFQLGWNPSGELSKSDNPFLFGLAIGLQFAAGIGGLELVHQNNSPDVWAYGYLGAVAGTNVGAGGGNPLFSGKSSPYSTFGVLGNSAAYVGNVWNLDNYGNYEGVFSCVSVTPRIRAFFPNAPAQVGGTVCTGEKQPGREATYTYTVGVSPTSSGTALQLGITDYSFFETIPVKQLENSF
jgi:RHS repeat-associated protein